MEQIEKLRIAYKKLKSSVFFNKTTLPLRNQLVLFENQIESKLAELETALFRGDGWEEIEKRILESIDVLIYPKKLKSIDEDLAIFNSDSMPIEMDKPQCFIELLPEGHILGALWVLEFGVKLDQNAGETVGTYEGMYAHSYGNRLKKDLINKDTGTYTYSPGMFEPYFSQYQSWRDHALDYAKERLNDKQDALILTLDFQSFYYSVDIQKSLFDGFLSLFNQKAGRDAAWLGRLNHFVYHVIERYSQRLRSIHFDENTLKLGERNVLPIGFLPSNILSNVVLTAFDKAVIQKWNPVYYGRYVDDIIIVDKVETNSEIYRLARATEQGKRLTADELMKRFLCDTGVLEREGKTTDKTEPYRYRISKDTLACGDSDVTIQDQKVKLFYFQSGATKALLTCFQSKIWNNVSEFRLLPDLDTIIRRRDYSEIFQLKNEDSINKLRSVTGIKLDKFALSKFLGKYRKVGGLIESKEEDAFSQDALMIFDERTLVENYTAWERLLEIFVVNHRLDIVKKLALRIISAIDRYTVPEGICASKTATHKALLDTLHAALCRTLALVWGEECSRLIDQVYDAIQNTLTDVSEKAVRYAPDSVLMFAPNQMNTARIAYCRTRMINKYVLPLAIDCILDKLPLSDAESIGLCSLSGIRQMINEHWHDQTTPYRYYPYMFLPQDISFALVYAAIFAGKDLPQPDGLVKQVRETFIRLNYPLTDESRAVFELDNFKSGIIEGLQTQSNEKRNYFATYIDNGKGADKTKLRVAIGNAALNVSDFRAVLDGKPNRSYLRYSDLRSMIDTAIVEKVDLLVLPESYVPLEWIPTLSRVCANSHLALITGVEHTVVPEAGVQKGAVYNLTAVILPYDKNGNSFSHVAFHHKVEYSPKELEIIKGYRYTPKMGNTYQLFCWRDVWFPVYCCYELTSIQDRSVFQTYADLVIAVEWNQDVPYFGNIVESLVRDLHCYCIQANSSDYGDSRVMRPADTIRRDVIKTKGGQNTCILWEEIDIKALRDFQVKSLEMQGMDKTFKQTPPDFDQGILEKKRKGTLRYLIKDTV